ncbi:MAG: aldo/keto reductase [Chloroflexi bacterium]|nr:MAG: aldo/keto reductase [Chloroflexota bacterium]
MILQGKATPNGTNHYAQTYFDLTYLPLSNTNLQVSQVGFGCYRIDQKQPDHKQALQEAFVQGINVIDTSSNYTDGGSELLIGSVLRGLSDAGKLTREQVVVVSKVGYLQGQNYELAQQRKREGRPFPNLVKYQAGLDHCIHPDFIEDQLTRSLDRLQLETIDCYLLHNPEYYLKWAKVANILLPDARREYYRRIRLAFQHLEKEVEQGRIQWYGISSNTFPMASNQYDFTSLEIVWEIANDISKHHHFRVVQLPFNLLETGAATKVNLPNSRSVLTYAHQKNLAVLVNRPLNAYHNNILTRLADVLPPSYPTTVEEVSTTVDSLKAAEKAFEATWLPKIETDAETKQQLQEYLAVGNMLEGRWQTFASYHNWREIRGQFLLPRAQAAIEFLSNQGNLPDMQNLWLSGYVDLVNETMAAISAFYEDSGHKQTKMLQKTAVSADPEWDAESLSKTAVRALRSTAGVTCTLVGMRHPHYIKDILTELKQPVPIKNRDASWNELMHRIEDRDRI